MNTGSVVERGRVDPLCEVVQYSDGMYIVANDALSILRRDIRTALNLPAVALDHPVCQIEMMLIFTVCHKTYNGAGSKSDARLRRCVSDIDYMRRHIEEGLPDYVIRALQVGIDRSVLTAVVAETYAIALGVAAEPVPEYTDPLERHRLPS